MRNGNITNILLLAIAVALTVIAMKPLLAPKPAHAVSAAPYPLYIEPGVYVLRAPDGTNNVYGKVAVDMQNGKIWGFPTLNGSPYPVDMNSTKPPESHPIELGTFAFQDTEK
ncbi:MAG: hypothetical protein WA708_02575 [Acidobacteriaceae bacterium]